LKHILACVFALAVAAGSPAAYAVQPDEIMSDPAKEARARDLSRELRCMVCQNQSPTASAAIQSAPLKAWPKRSRFYSIASISPTIWT
jgi:cytochrome c-type biogenesis protein CcmH/NrfF